MNPEKLKRPMNDFSVKPAMQRLQVLPNTPSDSKSAGRTGKRKNFKSRFPISRILMILAVLLIAGLPSYYFYNKSRQAEKRLNDPNTSSKEVIDEVVRKASKHIMLPANEQPTLATVSDVTKVKGQPFFQNAENGDKVLVYTQARKAYLYRPSKDIIIEVAPLNIDSLQSQKATQ